MSTPNHDRAQKSFGALEIKDESKGEVVAVVATLNTVDRDQEVIALDAISDGTKVKLSGYGHGAMFGEMPVGKGVLNVEGDKAVFRGKFFMSTPRGLEAFQTLKELGEDQEWSFGFRILDAENAPEEWSKRGAWRILKKLEPFEVSPVLIGAGVGTETVSVKMADDEAKAKLEREAQERAEAEAKAAAEVKAAEDAKVAEEKAAADAKAAEEVQRARAAVAVEEYGRIQRTLRKLGVA